jgi:hypothetical protein
MLNQSLCSRAAVTAATQAVLLWGTAILGGCHLRLELADSGVPVDGTLDAAVDSFEFPDAAVYHCAAPDGAVYESASACKDDPSAACARMVVGARCVVVGGGECLVGSPCPSSWLAAQSPASCTGGDGIVLGACGDTNAWYRLASGLTCTYDVASGTLVGMRRRSDSPQSYCNDSKSSQDEELTGHVPDPCVVSANPITYACSALLDAAAD